MGLDNIKSKQMKDTNDIKLELEKEAQNRENMRKGLERELIEQGKELFNEMDKNKSDLDSKLLAETENRTDLASSLRREIDNEVKKMSGELELAKNEIVASIENECKGLRNEID